MINLNQNFEFFLKNYYTARIDIKNFGGNNNSVLILDNSDSNSEISTPDWFNDIAGIGTSIHSSEGILDLKLKCINDGELKISLRGIDARDKNGKRFPIYIDFTDFSVNNKSLFDKNKLLCHDTPYRFSKIVQDSEIVDIHIQWMPFNSASEFKVEESNYVVQALQEKLYKRESQLKSIPQLCYTSLGYSALNGKVTYRNYIGKHHNTVINDFDGYCDNIWFTRFLKHKFPDEDFKINIFGVFNAHNNLAYPMDGKKVLYSMEDLNYRFLEMKYHFNRYALKYMDLSMGYDLIDHKKYLRFPYWIIWHISPESTEEDIEQKVEVWNSSNYEKTKDVTVISSHDIYGTRTLIDNDINNFVNILYAGRWKNNTSELVTKFHNNKNAFLKQFKFNLCSENALSEGYVTEKIFDAFECDCIPLYAGGENYLEPKIINPKSIIRWDADKEYGCDPNLLKKARIGRYTEYPIKWIANDDRNSDSIELFKNLLTDEKTYKEFKDQDRLLSTSVKQIMKMLADLEKHFERLIYC